MIRHVTCPLFTNVSFLVFSPRNSAFHSRARLISNCNTVCKYHGEKMRQIECFAAENSAVFHNSHLTIQVFLDRSRPGTLLPTSCWKFPLTFNFKNVVKIRIYLKSFDIKLSKLGKKFGFGMHSNQKSGNSDSIRHLVAKSILANI